MTAVDAQRHLPTRRCRGCHKRRKRESPAAAVTSSVAGLPQSTRARAHPAAVFSPRPAVSAVITQTMFFTCTHELHASTNRGRKVCEKERDCDASEGEREMPCEGNGRCGRSRWRRTALFFCLGGIQGAVVARLGRASKPPCAHTNKATCNSFFMFAFSLLPLSLPWLH